MTCSQHCDSSQFNWSDIYIVPRPKEVAAHDTAAVASLWPQQNGVVAVRNDDPLAHRQGINCIIGSGHALDLATPLTLRKLIAISQASTVHTYTEADAHLAEKAISLAKTQTRVARHAADTAAEAPKATPTGPLRRVIWVGTIGPDKALVRTIEALAAMPQPPQLTVRGQGPGRWAMAAVRLARANALDVQWAGDDWVPFCLPGDDYDLAVSPNAAVRSTFAAAGIPTAPSL